MNCPRCAITILVEQNRAGVTVDSCKQCHGMWLDRGELEKLIARAAQELDELESRPSRRPSSDGYPEPQRTSSDEHRGQPRKKKRWFDALGDVFD